MPDDKTPQPDQSQSQSQSQSQDRQRGQADGSTQGPGQAAPGLKDRDAETSDSYGNTRESGETPK